MHKTSLALAAAFACGGALAQSSVTMFGIVDLTLNQAKGSVSSKTQLTSGGYAVSRIGFRGTEDLGGGMSAGFWLEAAVNADNGQGSMTNTNNQANGAVAAAAGQQGLTFNRRSTVSLAGKWGEIRLGRDITPQGWNHSSYDPFIVGVGTSQVYIGSAGLHAPTGGSSGPNTRASNTIGYHLPTGLGGFFGQFMHYRGENASNVATADDGTGNQIRLGYASGPIHTALVLSRTKYAAGDFTTANMGGTYNFSVAKLWAAVDSDKISGGVSGKGFLVGLTMPVGSGEIRSSYSQYKTTAAGNPKSNKLAVGYVHHLSKRTNIYTTVARIKNSSVATSAFSGAVTAAGQSSTGFDIGIKHSF
ncbi:MAG TPA: porin [Burkholderiaceae bacterium]|nr:porin [Burkholderiaceae bacterium]